MRTSNRPPWKLGERGQVLILYVGVVTVIFVIAAITLDVGLWLAERRGLQRSADQASLAAAQDLPTSDAAAIAIAFEWAAKNGYEHGVDGVTVTAQALCKNTDPDAPGGLCVNPSGGPEPVPCSGPICDSIRVVISKPADLLFASLFGISSFDIEAGATALYFIASGGVYAIFVNEDDCGVSSALEISGQLNMVNGQVHSNSNVTIPGSDTDFNGPFTYQCDLQVAGSDNEFDPLPVPAPGPPQDPPIEFIYDDFPCTMEFFVDTDLNNVPAAWAGGDPSSGQLVPGVYCSTAKLSLSGQDVTGTVTLVAQGLLNVAGQDFDLTPFWNDVLLFSEDSSANAIDVSASGGYWEGLIMALNGRVQIQGSEGSGGLELVASVIADQVSISGSNFTLNGLLEVFDGPKHIRLVE